MGRDALTGMDIAHVRGLARKMQQEGDEIERLLQRVTAELRNTDWRGPDRDEFVQRWESGHAGHLRRVVDGLRSASREANEYANRQEWASRA